LFQRCKNIGDWNEQKIGISKCKNMHIGATLIPVITFDQLGIACAVELARCLWAVLSWVVWT